MPKPESPGLTVDIVFARLDKDDIPEILLVERQNEPFGWALPGGFVDIGETVKNAALRELREETGLVLENSELEFFGYQDDPSRDSRGHNISVVFTCSYLANERIKEIVVDLRSGSDAKNVKFFSMFNLPQMVFDHRKILMNCARRTLF